MGKVSPIDAPLVDPRVGRPGQPRQWRQDACPAGPERAVTGRCLQSNCRLLAIGNLDGDVRTTADNLGIGLYSTDARYRFWLVTEVDAAQRPGDLDAVHSDRLPVLDERTFVWAGLNPLTNDENGRIRASLLNVLAWAERDGATRVLGVNLYAHRHTDPNEVRRHLRIADPETVIGPGNDGLPS